MDSIIYYIEKIISSKCIFSAKFIRANISAFVTGNSPRLYILIVSKGIIPARLLVKLFTFQSIDGTNINT